MTETMKTINTVSLEAKAAELAAVLDKHKVFGDVDGKWLESEKRGLVGMVVSHVHENLIFDYLEVTYRGSCVRLIITTENVDGVAKFKKISAYDHPVEHPEMNYGQLNADIQALLS